MQAIYVVVLPGVLVRSNLLRHSTQSLFRRTGDIVEFLSQ
jgi:hypothetical protein